MDKDFLNSLKFLHKQYNRIIDDTSGIQGTSSKKPSVIISKAKQIIENETKDLITDEDIRNIEENTILKYAKDLEKFNKTSETIKMCKQRIHFNVGDMLNVPNPKRKSVFTNFSRDKSIGDYKKIVQDYVTETVNNGLDTTTKDEEIGNYEREYLGGEHESLEGDRIGGENLERSHIGGENEVMGENFIGREPGNCIGREYINSRGITNNRDGINGTDKEYINIGNGNENGNDRNGELIIHKGTIDNTEHGREYKKSVKELENMIDKENIDDMNIPGTKDFDDLFVESKSLNNNKPVLKIKKIGSTCTIVDTSDTDTSKTIIEENIGDKKDMRKYFKKWKNFTKFSAIEKNEQKIKVKIDNFLGNLEEKIKSHSAKSLTNLNETTKTIQPLKSKSSLHFSSTERIVDEMRSFQHRFQAQKEIIELQKKKLNEQKRQIEEMTLKKLENEAKESFDRCKEIYQTTANESKRYKYKVKLIKEEVKVNENEENGLKLNSMKAPKIVQIMEDRAKEREERRLLIKERKRLLDEEKKRLAEELIQKKKTEELEEKNKKLLLLKEERELIRQKELRKKLEKKQYLMDVRTALLHYRKKLLSNTIQSLKQSVQERQTREEVACKFYEFNTTYKFFRYWKYYSREKMKDRIHSADKLYKEKLLTRTWCTWKESHLDNVIKSQVAQDLYEMKLQGRVFVAFHHLVCVYHVQYKINLEKAEKHFIRQLLFLYFNRWQTLPAINKIEREKNERRKKWRQKVSEILPDYNPVQDD